MGETDNGVQKENSGADASSGSRWLTPRITFSLLAIALVAVFWNVIIGSHTFFYRDAGSLGFPMDFYQKESFAQGHLPLWDPYNHCGVPFLAQWGRWYPVSFLGQILPLPWFTNVSVILHLFWRGIGMFWLCRRWQLGAFGSTFAAMAFIFNGVTFSCLTWSNYIACLSWLPWVVGTVIAAWQNGGRWIPLAAFASAMQVLTATPELTVLSWLFIGALWLTNLLAKETQALASAGRLAAVVGLAAGISMVQMLPFFDLLQHSQRTTNATDAPWAVPGWGLANLLVPLFHCYESPQGTWFQDGQEFMASYYLGAGVLMLGIVGGIWNRSRRSVVILGAALFCWLMALGPHTIFFSAFKTVFPLVSVARFPVKFAILPAFLLPILAGWTIDRLGPAEKTLALRRATAALAIAILLGMAAILWFGHSHPLPYDQWQQTAIQALGAGVLMIILVGCALLTPVVKSPRARILLQLACLATLPIDALTHSPNIAPTLPVSILAPGMWEAKGNPPVPLAEGRVMIHPDAEQKLIYSHVDNLQLDFLVKRLGEWYNLNLLDGVPKLTGAITLRPANFDVLEQYLYYTQGAHWGEGLLDFLSITSISSPENPIEWHARTNALPLITGGQQPKFVEENKLLAAITSNDFEPRTEVYFPESTRSSITVSNQTRCTVRNVRFTSNRIEATVESSATAMVVLSESYYHNWHAFVDSQPTELLRANLAFQAIQVPGGSHEIAVVYTDPRLKTGAALSAISVVLCGLLWWRTKSGPSAGLFSAA
jgi:hypothetical protein